MLELLNIHLFRMKALASCLHPGASYLKLQEAKLLKAKVLILRLGTPSLRCKILVSYFPKALLSLSVQTQSLSWKENKGTRHSLPVKWWMEAVGSHCEGCSGANTVC